MNTLPMALWHKNIPTIKKLFFKFRWMKQPAALWMLNWWRESPSWCRLGYWTHRLATVPQMWQYLMYWWRKTTFLKTYSKNHPYYPTTSVKRPLYLASAVVAQNRFECAKNQTFDMYVNDDEERAVPFFWYDICLFGESKPSCISWQQCYQDCWSQSISPTNEAIRCIKLAPIFSLIVRLEETLTFIQVMGVIYMTDGWKHFLGLILPYWNSHCK